MKGHAGWLSSLVFSHNNRWLASGSHDRTIKLWDAATGQELRTLKGHKEEIKGLVFSPDGAQLISGSDDGTVKVWDPATGQELRTLKGHAEGVTGVALSPDGRWLASASGDQTVKVWDLASGQMLRTLKGHHDVVWAVAFSPDGARLASAGWDQTVRVWDTATGFELATLKGHTDRVLGVAFSPDGGRLASAGGKDLTVRVWDGRPVAAETEAVRESVGLLDYLFARPLRRADVLDYLRNAPTIGPQERQTALALAGRYREEPDPQKYHDAAWPVIRHPYSNVYLCQFARAQMNTACERSPDNATYRIALGIAQCRLGKFKNEGYAEARATLSKCDQKQPATMAFLALTQHQLGHKDQARTHLARLRQLLKEPQWAGNQEAEAFLREAAELIEGNKDEPKK